MRNAFRQFSISENKGRILTLLALSLLGAFFFYNPASANDKRVVTIFADGLERTVSTNALTVSEAVEKADIELEENDLVEPSLDTQIIENVFRVNVYRARPVTVVDRNVKQTVVSPYQSPRLIAQEAGIKVYDEDTFTLERVDNILESGVIGQQLTINRSTPVIISLYGKEIKHRTNAATVGEVLDEIEIDPAENDQVSHPLNKEITRNMVIAISHFGTKVITQEEDIPFDTETIQDSNRLAGSREVVEPGVLGRSVVTYEVVLRDGKEVSRKQLHKVVSKKPKKEVVIVGTKVSDPGSNAAIGQSLAAKRGWTGSQWVCLYDLWSHESGWNHLAANGSSGAYGIPQALPGNKMASAGSDWATNPATQISWGLGYIAGRYGSPCGAYNHWASIGWY